MTTSKFFGIIVLSGNSQLVDAQTGAENTARSIVYYKDNYHSYLFTDKLHYEKTLSIFQSN